MNQFFLSIQKILDKSLSMCREGNCQKAIELIELVLKSEELISDTKIWNATWTILSEIFQQSGEQELAYFSNEVVDRLDDADRFYYFGYDLIEKGFHKIALPILKKATILFPNDERISTELAFLFEKLGLYKEAKECLLKSSNLVENFFMPRYLVVFYSIMMGNLEEANKWYAGLDRLLACAPSECMENYTFMFESIKAMLQRGRLLASHTTLDSFDLLGWNAVINGNIVLHLSKYGIESMKGRYAFYQESPLGLVSCINQLKGVLDNLSIRPQRILSLPDRDSCILSHVAAKFLQCRVEIFSEATRFFPGLIVCYSSDLIASQSVEFLSQAHKDQVFWCHASNWTQNSIASDFISFFAQYACPPWDKQLSFDLETLACSEERALNEKPKVIETKPLKGTYQEIAESIWKMVDMTTFEVKSSNTIKLLSRKLFCEANDEKKNAFQEIRNRLRQWAASPVTSNVL